MKHSTLKRLYGLLSIAALVVVMIGCNGKDGANGATGATGAVTTTNESCLVCHGPNDVANVADVHAFKEDVNALNTRSLQRLKESNFVVAISNVTSDSSNHPQVTFNVKVNGANYTKLQKEFVSTVAIADLVPGGATGNPQTSAFFQIWASQGGSGVWLQSSDNTIVSNNVIGFDASAAASGNYTVTLPVTWGQATVPAANTAGTALAVPSYVNTGYADANPKRVWVRISAPSATQMKYQTGQLALNASSSAKLTTTPVWVNGYQSYSGQDYANGNTVNMNGVGAGHGFMDIAGKPGTGSVPSSVTTSLPYKKVEVTIEACRKCHGPQMNGAGHASTFLNTLACVLCHTPIGGNQVGNLGSGAGTTNNNDPAFVDYRFDRWIHLIHNAKQARNGSTGALVDDFTEVTYPQETQNCTVCHTASGRSDVVDNTSAWKTNPTAQACSSCHMVNTAAAGAAPVWVSPLTSAGLYDHTKANPTNLAGQAADTACALCHTAAVITTQHTITTETKNTPEYIVTLNVSGQSGSATYGGATVPYFKAGDTMVIKATLKNYADNSAVPATMYTAAKHTAGSTVAGVLSKASLYLYGPRAWSVPVLTKSAATLSATTGAPTQAQPLFGDATSKAADAQLTSDSTGFSYTVKIPATLANGTYMVRTIFANYGYVADTNYKIDSVAFQTIQVGTATPDAPIASASGYKTSTGSTVENACQNCHGTGFLEPHNARHSVIFNPDECLSCHDKSGNHGDPIHNRVHAIHAQSAKGDLMQWGQTTTGGVIKYDFSKYTAGLDWSEVTYPQGKPTVTTGVGVTALGIVRCITCHNSGNTAYNTGWNRVSAEQCMGCHADKVGAVDHILQMGGK